MDEIERFHGCRAAGIFFLFKVISQTKFSPIHFPNFKNMSVPTLQTTENRRRNMGLLCTPNFIIIWALTVKV